MNIENALAQSYIFNNDAGGLPITEIIRLEQQKRNLFTGGDRSNGFDRFERLQNLVVPAGLVMQNFPNTKCVLPKSIADLPVISESVFDQLMCSVSRRPSSRANTKSSRKRGIRIKNRTTNKNPIRA
jgi:hypothetical protein